MGETTLYIYSESLEFELQKNKKIKSISGSLSTKKSIMAQFFIENLFFIIKIHMKKDESHKMLVKKYVRLQSSTNKQTFPKKIMVK